MNPLVKWTSASVRFADECHYDESVSVTQGRVLVADSRPLHLAAPLFADPQRDVELAAAQQDGELVAAEPSDRVAALLSAITTALAIASLSFCDPIAAVQRGGRRSGARDACGETSVHAGASAADALAGMGSGIPAPWWPREPGRGRPLGPCRGRPGQTRRGGGKDHFGTLGATTGGHGSVSARRARQPGSIPPRSGSAPIVSEGKPEIYKLTILSS